MLIRSATRALSIAALVAGTAAAAAAQGATQGTTPQQILDRYTRAIDPQGRLATFEGIRTVGTMELPDAGMTADLDYARRRPNQMAMTISMNILGTMKQGFDGVTGWSNDAIGGPRILSDAEVKQMKDEADFRSFHRDSTLFTSIEPAGEAQVDGEATDCVKLTWKTEQVTTECYARGSGLLLESRTKVATPQGEVESVSRFSEYKPVSGVLMSHKMVNKMMGGTQSIIWAKIEAGRIDAKLFELPPEIRALRAP